MSENSFVSGGEALFEGFDVRHWARHEWSTHLYALANHKGNHSPVIGPAVSTSKL